ncbi:hypothetical protein OG21DRAFT_1497777 [Imleria badia]|nr:hypothetical protein OG21DRAFT_1497777 [Imleria badia]
MSAAVQSVLTNLQQNDYVSLAIVTAVGYDYVLTFSNEMEYIWTKPWTWVSTLFILVRYVGLYNLITSSLVGSSFVTVAKVCQMIYIINGWTFLFFLGAADFVMMLRVWAMYNRSRPIFGPLLFLFSLEIIFSIITIAIDSNPKNLPAVTIQILDISFCYLETTAPIWIKVTTILQITHGGVMCTLAIFQFVRQSLQMYRATKQWQLNRYMSLLVKQGILYFIAVFLFTIINVLSALEKLPSAGWQLILLLIVELVPMYTLTPRFILSMRELYARDVQVGHASGGGIDTGFGLSVSGRSGTAIVFADAGQDEDVEEIPMDVRVTQPE